MFRNVGKLLGGNAKCQCCKEFTAVIYDSKNNSLEAFEMHGSMHKVLAHFTMA